MPESEFTKSIGLHLKSLRKAAGYTSAAAFAEACGMPLAKYTEYEQGRRSMPFDTAWQIAERLGVSLDELGGHQPPTKTVELTYEEMRLMLSFRAIEPEQRVTVLAMVEGLAAQNVKKGVSSESSKAV